MPAELQGKRLSLYHATTAPTDETDEADTAYTRAGQIVDYSDSSTWSTTNIVHRDSGGFESPSLDTLSQTGSFNCVRQYDDGQGAQADEEGQVNLRDAHLNETESWFLLVVEDETGSLVDGMEGKWTKAYVTDWNTDAPLSGGAEWAFDFQATQEWTPFTQSTA